MSDPDLDAIAAVFPGVEVVAEEPVVDPGADPALVAHTKARRAGTRELRPVTDDPAVLELVESVEKLIGWFGLHEPGRLDGAGWKRIEAAIVAVRKKKVTERAVDDPVRMARADGPLSSKIAAARVAPTVGSRQEQVLSRLQAVDGDWVDGSDLSTETCGGSEGKRRLRELREDKGWHIEARPHPDSDTAWQYRLAPDSAPV